MFFKSDKEVNSRGKCFRPEGTHAEASRKERAPYVQNSKRWDMHREMYTQMRVCTKQTYCTLTRTRAQSAHTKSETQVPGWTSTCGHTYMSTRRAVRGSTQSRVHQDCLGRNKHRRMHQGALAHTHKYMHVFPCARRHKMSVHHICTGLRTLALRTRHHTWTHDTCQETAYAPECQKTQRFMSPDH